MSDCVLVIGGLGRIGKRYRALLRSMGVKYEIYDPAQGDTGLENYIDRASHCIIATPTKTHLDILSKIPTDKCTLVEKPVAFHTDFDPKRENTFVVCNYRYLLPHFPKFEGKVFYDYYNTGSDGLAWDCCQLVYIDSQATLKNESPFWTLRFDGFGVTYERLELSYKWMLVDFINGRHNRLWNLEDGWRMTRAVLEYEASHRHSS